jgi:hypothetical protein
MASRVFSSWFARACIAMMVGIGLCLFLLRFASRGIAGLVLWPMTILVNAFPPPCFERPGQPPFCEGTLIQLFANLVGLGLSVLFYSMFVFWVLGWWQRTRSDARAA